MTASSVSGLLATAQVLTETSGSEEATAAETDMSTWEHRQGRVGSSGGQSIYWQSWLPDEPRAVMFFVHGLAEHGGRYQFPFRFFVPRGFACWALDLRGHGQSSGRRVHVRSFDDYADDITSVLGEVGNQHEDLPVILVGHSMGGLISLRYALDHPQPFVGAILSSPALRAHPGQRPSKPLIRLATLIAKLAPRTLFPTHFDASIISRSPEVVEAYRSDPLVTCKVSARWFVAFEETMTEVRGRAAELSLPLLLMQSGGDLLVDPEASRQWADAAPERWLKHVEWPGFFHEMFNEPERLEVFETMASWLEPLLSRTEEESERRRGTER